MSSMRTGADYRESLRDGRRVFVLGEGLVEDVTTHPTTQAMVEEYVAWYDRHFDPKWQDVVLTPPRVMLGRLNECDICLPDRNVSRRHAEFAALPQGWTVQDLESTNGTFVNGSRLGAAPYALSNGDVIEVGASRLVYHAPRS